MGAQLYALGAAAVVVTVIILLLTISVWRARAKAARVEAIMQEHRAKMAEAVIAQARNEEAALQAVKVEQTERDQADEQAMARGSRDYFDRHW